MLGDDRFKGVLDRLGRELRVKSQRPNDIQKRAVGGKVLKEPQPLLPGRKFMRRIVIKQGNDVFLVLREEGVERIEGAWKLSQRASAADREGAITGLRAAGGDDALAIAALMAG